MYTTYLCDLCVWDSSSVFQFLIKLRIVHFWQRRIFFNIGEIIILDVWSNYCYCISLWKISFWHLWHFYFHSSWEISKFCSVFFFCSFFTAVMLTVSAGKTIPPQRPTWDEMLCRTKFSSFPSSLLFVFSF